MKNIVVDDISIKLITGNPDCKICGGIGVIEQKICECATLTNTSLSDKDLSGWIDSETFEKIDYKSKKLKFEKPENFGEITDSEHNLEPSRHTEHTPSRASLSSDHETSLESNESEEIA